MYSIYFYTIGSFKVYQEFRSEPLEHRVKMCIIYRWNYFTHKILRINHAQSLEMLISHIFIIILLCHLYAIACMRVSKNMLYINMVKSKDKKIFIIPTLCNFLRFSCRWTSKSNNNFFLIQEMSKDHVFESEETRITSLLLHTTYFYYMYKFQSLSLITI